MKKQYFIPQTAQTELGDSIYLCQTTSTNQEKAPGQQLAPKREEVQKVY